MVILMLCSNNFNGSMLSELCNLTNIQNLDACEHPWNTTKMPQQLNFSAKIGKLQALDVLDLSRNQIDGIIPTSLAWIDRLSVLNLSYNNFLGKIPTGTQLQSFDPSDFAGNPQLWGPPLQKMCGDQQVIVISSNEEEKDEPITWGFYVSMGLGFIVGFWGVCGSLIFIRPRRYSYFRFLNVLNDWLYVRVISIKQHFN